MSWAVASVTLLSVLVAGTLWIGLRDWERPPTGAAGPAEAAETLQTALGCRDCWVSALLRNGTDEWTMAVRDTGVVRCFRVDLSMLAEGRRPHGLARVPCSAV